jgi:L-alanine-DL-glutamate epimerase-like enolase superfamily enzyme
VKVEWLYAQAYKVPTDAPEADGTLSWDATTVVVAEVRAGDRVGLGYTYGDASIATLIRETLAPVVEGREAMSPEAATHAMSHAVRNSTDRGPMAYAISAVDIALHDLKARLLDVSLADLLGRRRDGVEIYGSGGFTSYDDEQLRAQAQGWRELGVSRVKIKVGSEPSRDGHRLDVVREAVGEDVDLMVDANGAFAPAQALHEAHGAYRDHEVRWFEEPVSSDDVDGMRRVRDGAPPGMQIAAGEYATSVFGFAALLDSVDVLQADVTRCGGVTGVRRADALAAARCMPLSAHCAPAVSAHVFAACEMTAHLEYFHDHVRVESLLFEGSPQPRDGLLKPDREAPGLGLAMAAEAERYRQ